MKAKVVCVIGLFMQFGLYAIREKESLQASGCCTRQSLLTGASHVLFWPAIAMLGANAVDAASGGNDWVPGYFTPLSILMLVGARQCSYYAGKSAEESATNDVENP